MELYYNDVSPPCHAVLMLSKALNLEINLKNVDLINGEHLTEKYLELNPAHTIPLLVDNGFVLWESRAINQYLCNKYAPDSSLYPKCPKKRGFVDCMLNYDIGSLYDSIRQTFFPVLFYGQTATDENTEKLKNNLKVLDKIIGNNNFVTGDELTIADLSLVSSCNVLKITKFDLSQFENVDNWYKRLSNDLPYYKEVDLDAAEDYSRQIRQKFGVKKADK